jgi:hypothetical protein
MLASRGRRPDLEVLRQCSGAVKEAASHSLAKRTIEGHATAVWKFFEFIQALDIPLSSLTSQRADASKWDTDTWEFHGLLLSHYCARVARTQRKPDTCKVYARRVQQFWIKTYRTTLWSDQHFTDLAPVTAGMARISTYVAQWREGLTAADTYVLIRTLRRWHAEGRRISPNRRATWDTRLVNTICASFEFAYGELFRYGEATSPDGDEFDPRTRLTRAHRRVVVHVADGAPSKTTILRPPKYKSPNRYSGVELTGEHCASDPLNWPHAMERMLESDPVQHSDMARTPLFRDTRGLQRTRDGNYEGGGKPLSNSFIRGLIRRLVKANPAWFGARDPASFGIHAFRIGAMNDLIDAGADYFVTSALGRWVSQSVMDYHRMKRPTEYAWRKRAMNVSLASTGEPSVPSHSDSEPRGCEDNFAPAPAHVRWTKADSEAADTARTRTGARDPCLSRPLLSSAVRAKADLFVAKAGPPRATQTSLRSWIRPATK